MIVQLPAGVYDYIRNRILSGELPPYSRLKEQELAAKFNVSRTPVREALARLEQEGLVQRSPRRGAVVLPLSLDEMDEIYEIRGALETLVARRACQHITDAEIEELACVLKQAKDYLEAGEFDAMIAANARFHSLLHHSSRSPRLVYLLRTLEDRLFLYRHKGLRYPGRAEAGIRQHGEMLESLKRRDTAELCRQIEEHTEQSRAAAIKYYLEEGRGRRMAEQAGEGGDHTSRYLI